MTHTDLVHGHYMPKCTSTLSSKKPTCCIDLMMGGRAHTTHCRYHPIKKPVPKRVVGHKTYLQ